MLATWWDHNMHGRRLLGHLAHVALLVILVFAIGASGEFDPSRDLPFLAWLVGLLVAGSVIDALRKRTGEAAVALFGSIVLGSLFLLGVLAVDVFVGRSKHGWPMIDWTTPGLMLLVVSLAGIGAYLTEDDVVQRRRKLLVVGGFAYVSLATFLSATPGPLATVGLAMLLIAVAGLFVGIVYVLARTPPAFPRPGR